MADLLTRRRKGLSAQPEHPSGPPETEGVTIRWRLGGSASRFHQIATRVPGLALWLLAARGLLRSLRLRGWLLLGLGNRLRALLPGHVRFLPAVLAPRRTLASLGSSSLRGKRFTIVWACEQRRIGACPRARSTAHGSVPRWRRGQSRSSSDRSSVAPPSSAHAPSPAFSAMWRRRAWNSARRSSAT